MGEITTEELLIPPESKEKKRVYYFDKGETIYCEPDPSQGIRGKFGYIRNANGIRAVKITEGPDKRINFYQGWESLDKIELYRADSNTLREGRSPFWDRKAGTRFGAPEKA